MTRVRSLQLRMGTQSVELLTEQDELRLALGNIYRAFLTEPLPLPPAGLEECGAGDWSASVAGRRFKFDSFPVAIAELEEVITQELLCGAGAALQLHAAAVTCGLDAVLLIGPSGSGKTTLALEFVRRGLRYLSDEYAIIEGDRLLPFPRSATSKFPGPEPVGQVLRIPDAGGYRAHLLPDLRADLLPIPMISKRLIFPTHDLDCDPFVRALGTAEVCTKLMQSTFDIRGKVAAMWPAIADVADGARACEFRFRDAESDLGLALEFMAID